MPESNQPFAAAEVPSSFDITQHNDITLDDLPELDRDEITDVDLHFSDDETHPTPFEPPEPPLPVAPVSLARVSFNAPATLSFDGYQETFQVTLLNLSTQGVACLGPHGLNVADTVRLSFALTEGDTATSLLCEVMWSQPSTPREDAYGLRFTAVDDRTLAQVEDVVRQRCDGGHADASRTAGIMHAVNSRAPARRNLAPWVVASAGAAMGMLATLAVMVIVESDVFRVAGTPAKGTAAPLHVGAAAPAPIDARVAPAASQAAPNKAPAPSVPTAAVAPGPQVAPAPAQPAAVASAPQAAVPPAPPATLAPVPEAAVAKAPPPAPKAAFPVVRFVGDLQVEEMDGAVALILRTKGSAVLHEEFWLREPQRLVVDVPAAGNGLRGRQFDVNGPLVARVRVGDHDDKVRFVIETNKNVASKIRAKASGDALRIELRRRS